MSAIARPIPGQYTSYGYRSAQVLRTSGRAVPSDGSGDYHLRNDRELLGAESDRLDRDNLVYEALLNRSLEITLGRDGFDFIMKSPDPELNKRVEDDFAEWGQSPEVTGRFDWQECQELALRSAFNRGDIGVIRTNLERIQYVEAPQITGGRRASFSARDGGRIEQGVELDRLGRPLAYWWAPYGRHGQIDRQRAKRIPAGDFQLFGCFKKFSQNRGVPVMSTAFPMVHRLNDVLDSEAIAWQQLARFTVAFNIEGGPAVGFSKSEADDDGRDSPPDFTDRVVDTEKGTAIFGEPGEKVTGVERNLPGANFPDSVRMYLRLTGMPFGIPLSMLLLDYSDLTYTASRAEVEQAFRVFIKRQRNLKRGHHDPITRWFINWGIEAGRYPLPPGGMENFSAFYRWDHAAPEFPWIDELKESQAWGNRIDRGLATQTEALQSVGSGFDEWLDRRAQELIKVRERTAQINAMAPDMEPLNWHRLAGYTVSRNSPPPGADTTEQSIVSTDGVQGSNGNGGAHGLANRLP